MTTFNGEEFIYGYPKDELMLFALACREAGITNEKLREINFNIEWAVDAVRKEVETVVRKNLDDIVNRIAEQTEPQTDCGDFADRLAYERGVKHAWEVAQKVFNSTVTFYEAEDVAKQIDKDHKGERKESE